jgi:hypothetical protein
VRLLRPARTLLVPVALAAAVVTAAASAADEPTAFGVAQTGSLKVVADVLLDARGGEMKGVWLNERVPCSRRRILVVRIDIDLVRPSGTTSRVRRSRSGSVGNCAEGGPNFGFDLRARALGLGCADGRWAPGRYSMTTRVTDTVSGLRASASLYRQVTRRC